jgi:HPt (histidine-containing phosphotransfer) domain-containing protein
MPTEPDRADAGNDSQQRALDALASFRDRARMTNLARVDVIAEALNSLRAGVRSENSRTTARRAAHTLVGSAGTFGFAEASQLGRTLEAVLDEADGTEGAQEQAERGLVLVARLRGALRGTR